MRLAYPSEVSPNQVAGYRLPASPRSSAPKRSGPRGVSRSDYPTLRRAPGPPLGFGPSTGLLTDRSGRPVAGSAPPVRFFAPTTTTRPQVRFTRVCLTRHRPASRFRPPRRFAPCDRCRSEDRRRPWGSPFRAFPLRSAALVTEPVALLPFPALPAFSSEDEKVGSSAAASGRYSDRRSVPFRRLVATCRVDALLGCLPLRSTHPAAMEPASRPLPSCASGSADAEAAATPALQGLDRRRGLANSLEPTGSLGVCRLGLPDKSSFRRRLLRVAFGASPEQQIGRAHV